jgi:hypothetical protein
MLFCIKIIKVVDNMVHNSEVNMTENDTVILKEPAQRDELIPQEGEIASCGRGVVEYHSEGKDRHVFSTDMAAFPGLTVDFTGVPEARRGGVASRLLCFAALYCFCNTLTNELAEHGAVVRGITGRATPTKIQDDYHRTRIRRIFIDVVIDMDEKYLPVLEECRGIMEQGSLITYSLTESIEVEHMIRTAREAVSCLR